MKKTRNRSWQSATVKRAFEVLRSPDHGYDIPPIVVDALREMAEARQDLTEENRVAASSVEKAAIPSDGQRFHALHTYCQVGTTAMSDFLLASMAPAIREMANYSDAGIAGAEWMISNAIQWGLPALLLPFIYFEKLSTDLRNKMLWIAIFLIAGVVIVTMLGR